MSGLNGKNAIVTGGSGGIGAAIVSRLLDAGCQVGVFDLKQAEIQHDSLTFHKADLTDHAQAMAAVTAFEQDVGPCDILVNCLGWDQPKAFLETEPGQWDKVIAINLTAHLNMHHLVCPGMVARQGGRVINIASDAARAGAGMTSVYSACKGGLISFTKSVAREWARYNVLVNVVSPGPTLTPLLEKEFGESGESSWLQSVQKTIPLRRLASPNDIAGAVLFLAGEDASYMTGQVISVSGGLTMSD